MPVRASEPAGRFEAGRRSAFTDRTGLAIVGFFFAGVTIIVIAIAVLVVRGHVNAKIALEQSTPAASAAASPQR